MGMKYKFSRIAEHKEIYFYRSVHNGNGVALELFQMYDLVTLLR